MSQVQVVTSALTLARELRRYGEPELADRARSLTPDAVLTVGARAGTLWAQQVDRWPKGPKNAALLLAATEYLEGAARPCRRSTRLPESSLPPALQAAERERWAAVEEVARVNDRRPPDDQ